MEKRIGLKIAILQCGYTLTDFAKEIGVTREYISALINRSADASYDLAKIISDKTNGKVEVEELIKQRHTCPFCHKRMRKDKYDKRQKELDDFSND